jgi:hypothetical protein
MSFKRVVNISPYINSQHLKNDIELLRAIEEANNYLTDSVYNCQKVEFVGKKIYLTIELEITD